MDNQDERHESIDDLVDRFVAAVNAGERRSVDIGQGEGTPSVLVGEPDEYGDYDWAIKPYAGIDWIEPLEERLGRRLPTIYRSLMTRYIFPSFETREVFLFGNTPEGTEYWEFRARLYHDEYLYPALPRCGLLQIGNPWTLNYDPVCFAHYPDDDSDRPLIQIDHEAILCHQVVEVVGELAPSLRHLMLSVIEDPHPGPRPG